MVLGQRALRVDHSGSQAEAASLDPHVYSILWPVPGIQPWKTGSGAQSPFSTGAVSWQPIHVAAIVA